LLVVSFCVRAHLLPYLVVPLIMKSALGINAFLSRDVHKFHFKSWDADFAVCLASVAHVTEILTTLSVRIVMSWNAPHSFIGEANNGCYDAELPIEKCRVYAFQGKFVLWWTKPKMSPPDSSNAQCSCNPM
jgi:hypothetical protein